MNQANNPLINNNLQLPTPINNNRNNKISWVGRITIIVFSFFAIIFLAVSCGCSVRTLPIHSNIDSKEFSLPLLENLATENINFGNPQDNSTPRVPTTGTPNTQDKLISDASQIDPYIAQRFYPDQDSEGKSVFHYCYLNDIQSNIPENDANPINKKGTILPQGKIGALARGGKIDDKNVWSDPTGYYTLSFNVYVNKNNPHHTGDDQANYHYKLIFGINDSAYYNSVPPAPKDTDLGDFVDGVLTDKDKLKNILLYNGVELTS